MTDNLTARIAKLTPEAKQMAWNEAMRIHTQHAPTIGDAYRIALALRIQADMPEPVDPFMVEARKMVATSHPLHATDDEAVKHYYTILKRGAEIGRGEG